MLPPDRVLSSANTSSTIDKSATIIDACDDGGEAVGTVSESSCSMFNQRRRRGNEQSYVLNTRFYYHRIILLHNQLCTLLRPYTYSVPSPYFNADMNSGTSEGKSGTVGGLMLPVRLLEHTSWLQALTAFHGGDDDLSS